MAAAGGGRPPPAPRRAPPPPPAPLTPALPGGALLNVQLWRYVLFVGQPMRLALALNALAGRSVRALALELARRLLSALGWLHARVESRRARALGRRWLDAPPRRWHVAAAALAAARLAGWAAARWGERASGVRARRKALQARLAAAEDFPAWVLAALELEALRAGWRPPPPKGALEGSGAAANGAAADGGAAAAAGGAEPPAGEPAAADGFVGPASVFAAPWRGDGEASLYDARLVAGRAAALAAARAAGDARGLLFTLRCDLIRDLGGAASRRLHARYVTAPAPVARYVAEARAAVAAAAGAPELPLDERLAFLREARHAFGRTALVLSGGGSFGSFHMGVVQALLGARLLPRVFSGSSAGAIVAAIVCTRSDADLEALFAALPELQGIDFYSSNTLLQVLRHLVAEGTLQDPAVLTERLRRLLGEATFADAFARSGRILNISVTAADTREPPRLLNYLTSPDVLVWSAVAASSAFPFLYAPQQLLARDARGRVATYGALGGADAGRPRRWRDGSLEEDLPMRGLSEMFNVTYFLVSQANPYLLPIVAAKRALPEWAGDLAETEFKHRCRQAAELGAHLPRPLAAAARPLAAACRLVNQPWEGDVTMVLPAGRFAAGKAVFNLSRADLLATIDEGRRAAWAKLSAIACGCAVEVTLDEALARVTAQAAAAAAAGAAARAARAAAAARYAGGAGAGGPAPPAGAAQQRLRGSLPSWVHMPALGMPRSASAEGAAPLGVHASGSAESLAPPPRRPSLAAAPEPGSPRFAALAAGGGAGGAPRHARRDSDASEADSPVHALAWQMGLTLPEEEEAAAADGGGGDWPRGAAPTSPVPQRPRAEVWKDLFGAASAASASAEGLNLFCADD